MHPRRKARVGVLEALYAESIAHEDQKKILIDLFNREDFSKKTKQFVETLFFETIKRNSECENLIMKYLKNWEFSRIALMDKLIIRMAITEMIFLKTSPPKVAISEAIEIAKEYSTEESSSFVNGILDAVFKKSMVDQNTQDQKLDA